MKDSRPDGVVAGRAGAGARRLRVLVTAPSLDMLGGQSRQAARLVGRLREEPSLDVSFLPVNPRLPGALRGLQGIKYVRTVVTTLWYWATLLRRAGKCDILHVFSASYYSYMLSAMPAVLVGKLFGKKTILNYHSGEAEDHLRNWRLTAIPVMRRADAILVPSGYLVDVFARFGLRARSIFNTVELDRFQFRDRRPLRPIFLTSRLLEPLYNVPCVLRAFALIQEHIPEARLTVAGEGFLRAELEDLARALGLRNTEFVGRVPFEEMPEMYDSADVYLTATDIDNMPISVIECLAAGLPVVTTDAGGIPYIVSHEETALIVPRDDHEAMAAAALRLLEDGDLAARIAARGREHCGKFSWQSVRGEWLAFYHGLADVGTARRSRKISRGGTAGSLGETGQKGVAKVLFLITAGLLLAMSLTFTFAQRYWSGAAQQQQRPRRVTAASGDTIAVKAGGSLQKAVDAARPGDTIILEAGATFVGPVTLPNKGANAAWITIQSSRLAELPEGVRVGPSQAGLMPKIVSRGQGENAIRTAPGANHYKLLGLEIAPATKDAFIYDLVNLGDWNENQDTPAEEPSFIVIDRCYIHTFPDQSLKRGVALNARDSDIVNSYIAGFKVKGQEAQAILSWNSTGNHKIINNYLEGAGENVMFGGSTGGLSATGTVPTNIEIRRNHMFKPMSWRGQGWTVKNLFELKSARNVVVEGNVFENNWADAQSGYAILFTPRPNDSGPGAVVENVLFINNVVRNTGGAVHIIGRDTLDPRYATDPTVRGKNIRVVNNVFENVSRSFGDGVFLKIGDGAENITFDHNTAFHAGNITIAFGPPVKQFTFTNNLVAHNEYGVHGNDVGVGNAAISQYFPGSTWAGNAFVGAGPPPDGPFHTPADNYPRGNSFPRTWAEVGFVGQASGNYRLKSGSPYKGRATDGKDVGCGFDQLEAALGGAVKQVAKSSFTFESLRQPEVSGGHPGFTRVVRAGSSLGRSGKPHRPNHLSRAGVG